nr:hypothetical protein L204_04319 [Cryptococcus depauperatus CBS 7855]
MIIWLTFTLDNNNDIVFPRTGFSTWKADPGEAKKAQTGYRRIDYVLIYGMFYEVGQGIKESGIPQDELFMVSKLWNSSHRPGRVMAELHFTLKKLSISYFDPISSTGPSLSSIKATTFSPRLMMVKLPSTGTLQSLIDTAKEKDISIITAYSPLGHNITGKPRIINNEKVKANTKKKNPTRSLHKFLSIGPLIRSKFESFDPSEKGFKKINKIGKANPCRTNTHIDYNLV